MLYRLLVATLIAASASVTAAAPAHLKAARAVLDAGDALEPRMAALEAKVNELHFADMRAQMVKKLQLEHPESVGKVKKLAKEHGVKEQGLFDRLNAWRNRHQYDETPRDNAPGFSGSTGPIGYPTFGDSGHWSDEPDNIEPLRGMPSMTGREI
jgi:hypothetical protein